MNKKIDILDRIIQEKESQLSDVVSQLVSFESYLEFESRFSTKKSIRRTEIQILECLKLVQHLTHHLRQLYDAGSNESLIYGERLMTTERDIYSKIRNDSELKRIYFADLKTLSEIREIRL